MLGLSKESLLVGSIERMVGDTSPKSNMQQAQRDKIKQKTTMRKFHETYSVVGKKNRPISTDPVMSISLKSM